MKYYNKLIKYNNKLIQFGSSSSESEETFNIFDNITIQHPDTINRIIVTFCKIIYFPEIFAEIDLTLLKKISVYPEWHMPPSVNNLTLENIPKSLDEIANLYFTAKISEDDREIFISAYQVPFYRTEKTLKELYYLNKNIMKDTLDQLIISKRIQRLMNVQRETFIFEDFINWKPMGSVRNKIPDIDERMKKIEGDLSIIIKKYKSKYEEQEGVIASTWVTAVEKEPLFKDKN
jgi:hypothetical protein